jgi:hypothetical protein
VSEVSGEEPVVGVAIENDIVIDEGRFWVSGALRAATEFAVIDASCVLALALESERTSG